MESTLSRILLCFALLCFFNLLTWTCLHAHYQTNKNQNAKPESETREIKTGFKHEFQQVNTYRYPMLLLPWNALSSSRLKTTTTTIKKLGCLYCSFQNITPNLAIHADIPSFLYSSDVFPREKKSWTPKLLTPVAACLHSFHSCCCCSHFAHHMPALSLTRWFSSSSCPVHLQRSVGLPR